MPGASDGRRYRVLDVLGRGGFGTVYRGELLGSQGFTKEVALKILNQGVEAHPQHLALLRDEARVLGLVRHRSIVAVDGLVKLDDRWCVVMEYVRGVTLKDLLNDQGTFPPAVALQIAEEVASALDAAYAATSRDGTPLKLLHRDVKPSNIQVTPHGEVKLLDFGIARAEFETQEASTPGVVLGSLPYVAPERLHFADSPAVDVYALALTLAALLGGRIPLRGPDGVADHTERLQEIEALLVGANVPETVRQLVHRGAAFEAAERPTSRQFERDCRALRQALEDETIRDWAEPRVEAILKRAQPSDSGEFTGRLLTEAGTTEQGAQLAELLGLTAGSTFDDLATADDLLERPSPPDARDEHRHRRSWVGAGVFAVALVASAGVIAIVAAMAGGSAVFGGLLVAVASNPKTGCASHIQVGRQVVLDKHIEPRQPAFDLLDEAERVCLAGHVSSWQAALLTQTITVDGDDGLLDATELANIERRIRDWEP